MTDTTEPIDEALDDHDFTLALTPGHVLILVISVFVLLRVIRGFRS